MSFTMHQLIASKINSKHIMKPKRMYSFFQIMLFFQYMLENIFSLKSMLFYSFVLNMPRDTILCLKHKVAALIITNKFQVEIKNVPQAFFLIREKWSVSYI